MSEAPLFTTSSTVMDLVAHVRSSSAAGEPRSGARVIKIRVLSNYSTQYLVAALGAALVHRGVTAAIDETAYDQWEFVFNSAESQSPVDYTLVLLSTSKLLLTARATDPQEFAEYLFERISAYRKVVGGRVVVAIPESLREGVDQSLVFHTWVQELQVALRSRLGDSCPLFEMDAMVREFGFDRWSAPSYYLTSKLPCHPNCFPAIGSAVADLIWSLELRPTRLVIVDLDNTLWEGEVGEVGWQGVGLDAAEGGYPHLLLQRMLLDMKHKGVLLAIASKNDEASALEVFRRRPEMLLSIDDFSAMEINWRPKSDNVVAILQRLNLSKSGIAFIDDSRLEREEILLRIPQIHVPDLPDAPEDWIRHLSASKYFSLGVVREEDGNRAEMYKSEAAREKLSGELGNYDEFLRELRLVVTPEHLGVDNLSRAHELVQKTNQFNLTGRRSTESELRAMMDSDEHLAFVYRLADRYGTYGIVSVVILTLDSDQWMIHTWVMSCRAMGRQVEYAVFDHLLSELRPSHGVLAGEYVPSDKNAVLASFLPSLGFLPTDGSSVMKFALSDPYESRAPTVVQVEPPPNP
jgi:FkbH-like protein